jgi:hypothetical protein
LTRSSRVLISRSPPSGYFTFTAIRLLELRDDNLDMERQDLYPGLAYGEHFNLLGNLAGTDFRTGSDRYTKQAALPQVLIPDLCHGHIEVST